MPKEEIKTLKLPIPCSLTSEAVIRSKELIIDHTMKAPVWLQLEVSIYNVVDALSIMITDDSIGVVIICRDLSDGEFKLTDTFSKVRVIGGLRNG